MRRLLLDTHIWVWYVAGSPDLPLPLREAIDESAGLSWLSPISLWEVGVLAGKGRLKLRGGPGSWTDRALAAYPMREAAVTFEVARTIHGLELLHSDPADRFLAATALVYDLTLVTVDRHLCTAPWLDTLTA